MEDATSAEAAEQAGQRDEGLPRMSFLEHLDELRRRLIICTVTLLVAFLVCWNFAPEIFAFLERPIMQFLPPGEKLAYTSLTSPFMLYMKVAFLSSIFVASPVVMLQLWLFIAPGLYPKERYYAVPFILFATLFFVGGGWFGFDVVFPMACKFFVDIGKEFNQVITVDDYFSFASKMILAMGLVFETPILIFFLARLGIVTPQFLLRNFKYAVVAIFIIAAVITPTPDMVTQSALAVPMILLYALGIAISFLFGKKREE
ncbi:MAG: twin-arginine translocase subunit TatC [Thermoanaerobaculia bacterium]|jgi:sec-independent protein translocase protein TatC